MVRGDLQFFDIPVQSCNRGRVNVTIKIKDELYREARHRAVDAGQSLSAWVADRIAEATGNAAGGIQPPRDLLSALGEDSLADVDLDVPKLGDEPEGADFQQDP